MLTYADVCSNDMSGGQGSHPDSGRMDAGTVVQARGGGGHALGGGGTEAGTSIAFNQVDDGLEARSALCLRYWTSIKVQMLTLSWYKSTNTDAEGAARS
jgi:hypothetical protein